MNLDVEIKTNDNCSLILTDNSQYQTSSGFSKQNIKFQDSVSIVVVKHQDVRVSETQYFKILEHEDSLQFTVPINFDGLFEVTYIVLPTEDWFIKYGGDKLLSIYNNLIFTYDGTRIIKHSVNGIEYIDPSEILKYSSITTSTISLVFKEMVSICSLRKCYINLCYQIFNDRAFSACWNKNKVDSELIYKRDLVWMAINVIKYLFSVGQTSEIARILSQINSCNGICKPESSNTVYKNEGCGCSQN